MDNKYKEYFIQKKKERREKKRTIKRDITAEEVICIFEKVLEGWNTIKIYNTIIQNNPNSCINKKKTENISTGNCKVYESELSKERFEYYTYLRLKVYDYNNQKIKEKYDNEKNIIT
jgi:hypothetical protein